MRRLPADAVQLTVVTSAEQQTHYRGVPGCLLPGSLSDEALLRAYRQADVLAIPLMDCTANNVVLESMACGTPVMVNRVGGIPEYVNEACNVVLDGKREDEWVARLTALSRDRAALAALRPRVRTWAESFAWPLIAAQFRALYREML
jgi:glycosyltransferase involved in cell wall biosynthesis